MELRLATAGGATLADLRKQLEREANADDALFSALAACNALDPAQLIREPELISQLTKEALIDLMRQRQGRRDPLTPLLLAELRRREPGNALGFGLQGLLDLANGNSREAETHFSGASGKTVSVDGGSRYQSTRLVAERLGVDAQLFQAAMAPGAGSVGEGIVLDLRDFLRNSGESQNIPTSALKSATAALLELHGSDPEMSSGAGYHLMLAAAELTKLVAARSDARAEEAEALLDSTIASMDVYLKAKTRQTAYDALQTIIYDMPGADFPAFEKALMLSGREAAVDGLIAAKAYDPEANPGDSDGEGLYSVVAEVRDELVRLRREK